MDEILRLDRERIRLERLSIMKQIQLNYLFQERLKLHSPTPRLTPIIVRRSSSPTQRSPSIKGLVEKRMRRRSPRGLSFMLENSDLLSDEKLIRKLRNNKNNEEKLKLIDELIEKITKERDDINRLLDSPEFDWIFFMRANRYYNYYLRKKS